MNTRRTKKEIEIMKKTIKNYLNNTNFEVEQAYILHKKRFETLENGYEKTFIKSLEDFENVSLIYLEELVGMKQLKNLIGDLNKDKRHVAIERLELYITSCLNGINSQEKLEGLLLGLDSLGYINDSKKIIYEVYCLDNNTFDMKIKKKYLKKILTTVS